MADDSLFEVGEKSIELVDARQMSENGELQRQKEVREGIRTGSLFLLALLAAGVMLLYLRFVLVPLVLAKFFCYMLDPVVIWLHRGRRPCREGNRCRTGGCVCCPRNQETCQQLFVFGRLPHWLAVTISLLLAVAALVGLGLLVAISISQLVQESDKYEARANELIGNFVNWADSHGLQTNRTEFLGDFILSTVPISDLIVRLANFMFQFVSDFLMLILFLIYMLYEGNSSVGYGRGDLREQMDYQIRHYVVVKVVISAVTGFLVGLILFVLHVDLSLVFGLLSFLLNFIPNVGSMIATLLPIPVVVLDPTKAWTAVIMAIVFPAAVQLVVGNFVEPKVLGRAMDLRPIVVLVALVFWGTVWGVVGAIISVPLTAVLGLWLSQLDHPFFKFMSQVLSGGGEPYEDQQKRT